MDVINRYRDRPAAEGAETVVVQLQSFPRKGGPS
jgi:hypothetical protein